MTFLVEADPRFWVRGGGPTERIRAVFMLFERIKQQFMEAIYCIVSFNMDWQNMNIQNTFLKIYHITT
jgi:hypothetical protein